MELYRNVYSDLDVVIPVYQEESHIVRSISTIEKNLMQCNIDYRFIIVDDGSKDNTWKVLEELVERNPRVSIIRLSRNFGKESAICAGIEYTKASAVLVMDCDLQHPPNLIPDMLDFLREGYDVVEGVKSRRGKEHVLYRFCTKCFYFAMNRTCSLDFSNASDFKLLNRKVIEAYLSLGEKTTFFRGMSSWVGFNRKQIPFEVAERAHGETKWSFVRLMKLAVNATTSYTTLPLQFVSILGAVLFFISIIMGIQTLIMKISGKALDGFTTVILLLLLIGSTIMISLGIIGIYLAKIYHEVKDRPRFIVSAYLKGGEGYKE